MLSLAMLGIAVVVIFTVIVVNRLRCPDYADIEIRDSKQVLLPAGPDLSVLTWNIGYGALGKDADLYVDGGKSLRALSKPEIVIAAQEIVQIVSQTSWDLICMQEIATAGVTTHNVDVRGMIDKALPNRQRFFWADLKAVSLPRVLRICHGMATYSRKMSDLCRVIDLPDANAYMLGFIKKPYVGLLNRLAISNTDKAWVIINIHLPIFNTTPATRTAHLGQLFDVAKREYEKGNYVVMAGDWNTRLCSTSFPHTTDPKFLTCYTDFPQDSLPAGWKIKVDPTTPTVRAIHAPFVKDQIYTTVFDGFIVSPNVRVSSVKTLDMDFAHTDHQPVEGRFSADR